MARPSPARPQGADADVALRRAGRRPGYRHVAQRVAAVTHRPVRTLVEHRRQAVPKQEAVPRLCGPVRPPAAHRAAPVPDNHPCFERTEEDKHVGFSEAIEAWRETDTLLMSWGNKASHSCIRST